MLASINPKQLTRDGLLAYYTSQKHLYQELGFYTRIRNLRNKYNYKERMYADSIKAIADKNS